MFFQYWSVFIVLLKDKGGQATSFDFPCFKQHDNIRGTIAATVPGMEPLKDIGVAKQNFMCVIVLFILPYLILTKKRNL